MTSVAAPAQTRTAYQTLLTDVTDGVALITINRPDVRNAVNRQEETDREHRKH